MERIKKSINQATNGAGSKGLFLSVKKHKNNLSKKYRCINNKITKSDHEVPNEAGSKGLFSNGYIKFNKQ